jgi:DNA polymerase-4
VTVEDEDDQPVPPGRQRKIIHVDMDAFYAFDCSRGRGFS